MNGRIPVLARDGIELDDDEGDDIIFVSASVGSNVLADLVWTEQELKRSGRTARADMRPDADRPISWSPGSYPRATGVSLPMTATDRRTNRRNAHAARPGVGRQGGNMVGPPYRD